METATPVSIHPVKLVALKGETEIELSLVELKHLAYFLANKDRVIGRKELFDELWRGRAAEFSNIVDVYVNYLRKKIGKEVITTVRGQGYRMAA